MRMFGPRGHGKFEEWCALAALGDLDPQQLNELELHAVKCAKCRQTLEDATQASLQLMTAFWENHKPTVTTMPPDGMRSRFLRRLREYRNGSEETLPAEDFALQNNWAAKIATRRTEKSEHLEGYGDSPKLWLTAAVAFAMAAALSLGSYYLGLKTRNVGPVPQPSSAPTLQAKVAIGQRDLGESPEERSKRLASALVDLQKQQSIAKDERILLEQKLAASTAKLASLQQADASELQRSLAEAQETSRELELAKKANENLNKKVLQTESLLLAQEHHNEELQGELDVARSSVREQDDVRVAAGQLGEMVTAKNLHIVDVYDTDGGGARRRAFGRVFYVEGKSLLFYAYDLQDARQARANVVFHVWGGRAGTKEVTHSLGLLHNDDAKEGLWTLTFDDPLVLAKINSIFVTVESANRRDTVPHGKRVLYAYFGNPPNHP